MKLKQLRSTWPFNWKNVSDNMMYTELIAAKLISGNLCTIIRPGIPTLPQWEKRHRQTTKASKQTNSLSLSLSLSLSRVIPECVEELVKSTQTNQLVNSSLSDNDVTCSYSYMYATCICYFQRSQLVSLVDYEQVAMRLYKCMTNRHLIQYSRRICYTLKLSIIP